MGSFMVTRCRYVSWVVISKTGKINAKGKIKAFLAIDLGSDARIMAVDSWITLDNPDNWTTHELRTYEPTLRRLVVKLFHSKGGGFLY